VSTIQTTVAGGPDRAPRQCANAAQWISAICSVGTAISAIIAVSAFMHAVHVERVRSAEESIARLYPMENDLEKLLMTSEVDLRALFRNDRDGKHLEELMKMESNTALQKFKAACAFNGNLFEYYLLIRENVRGHPQGEDITEAWDEYFRTVCEDSYGFRTYFYDVPNVWTTSLKREVDMYAGNLPREKNPKEKWKGKW
jgi:hypothetical protein